MKLKTRYDTYCQKYTKNISITAYCKYYRKWYSNTKINKIFTDRKNNCLKSQYQQYIQKYWTERSITWYRQKQLQWLTDEQIYNLVKNKKTIREKNREEYDRYCNLLKVIKVKPMSYNYFRFKRKFKSIDELLAPYIDKANRCKFAKAWFERVEELDRHLYDRSQKKISFMKTVWLWKSYLIRKYKI